MPYSFHKRKDLLDNWLSYKYIQCSHLYVLFPTLEPRSRLVRRQWLLARYSRYTIYDRDHIPGRQQVIDRLAICSVISSLNPFESFETPTPTPPSLADRSATDAFFKTGRWERNMAMSRVVLETALRALHTNRYHVLGHPVYIRRTHYPVEAVEMILQCEIISQWVKQEPNGRSVRRCLDTCSKP